MLLNIYIGSTLFSFFVDYLFTEYLKKEIPRDGYILNEDVLEKNRKQKIMNAIKLSIPGFNIAKALYILCLDDKIKRQLENKLVNIEIKSNVLDSEVEENKKETEENITPIIKSNIEKPKVLVLKRNTKIS